MLSVSIRRYSLILKKHHYSKGGGVRLLLGNTRLRPQQRTLETIPRTENDPARGGVLLLPLGRRVL